MESWGCQLSSYLRVFFLPVYCFFFGLTFLALVGYCSAVSLQLAESDRAPCTAPVPPVCHLAIHNICLFLSSPMQASPPPPPQQNHLGGPVLDGPGAFSFWSAPLHTCTIVFVCLSCIPPPCPMFANGSLFVLLSRTQRSLF
jgi:hypothetical protein